MLYSVVVTYCHTNDSGMCSHITLLWYVLSTDVNLEVTANMAALPVVTSALTSDSLINGQYSVSGRNPIKYLS